MAEPLDVLTIDEAQRAVNIGASRVGHDQELALWVSGLSEWLDDRCGPIVQRDVTDEPHDGGYRPIFLEQLPVAAVTTIKEYSGTTLTTLTAESVTSQTANQFWLDRRLGIVYRRSGGADYCWAAGRGNVLVTYSAGRYADTASVSPRFKVAAGLMLHHFWQASASWFEAHDQLGESGLAVLPPNAQNRVVALIGREFKAPAVA